MPIFELGYRHWEGELRSPYLRWWTVARTGIATAWKSKLLRWLLSFAWTPLLYYAPLFFAIGYVTDPARNLTPDSFWFGLAQGILGPDIAERLLTDPESVRPAAWSMAFYYFFSYAQAWWMMLVVAMVGPRLVAQDVRSKAFLLYFSKPITRLEYMLGKLGTILFYIWIMTLFPALLLYAISIAFSPDFAALVQTSEIVLRIFASCMVISIPSALAVLFFSSLTSDSRFATFGWIGYWTIGEVSYSLLANLPKLEDSSWIFLLSLRKTASVVMESIFNVEGQIRDLGGGAGVMDQALESIQTPYSATTGFLFLLGISVFFAAVLYRRISAPMRI